MFRQMQSSGAQALHLVQDPRSGLQAIIAVQPGQRGPALAGCSYLPWEDEYQALQRTLQRARSMSYRTALAGLPFSGGHAWLRRPAHVRSRAELFEAFGRVLDELSGRVVGIADEGSSCADMDCLAQYTRYVGGISAQGEPALHGALGVFAAIRATAMARLGSDDLSGLRVAVHGLDDLGWALAAQLAAAGVELLVSDADAGRLELAQDELGARVLESEVLLASPCDLLVPCSGQGLLDSRRVAGLRCAAVAGAVDGLLAAPELAEDLEARGILLAPDFVINIGALLHAALHYLGEPASRLTAELAQIGLRLTDIYAQAQAHNCSPTRIAVARAEALLHGATQQ